MERSRWAHEPEAEQAHTPETSLANAAPSSLSAVAETFAPVEDHAPPPDVSTADEFAQTGAQQDDLFDDVVPAEESMRIRSDDDLFSEDFTPAPQPVVEEQDVPPLQLSSHATRGTSDTSRGREWIRGRGRGSSDDRGTIGKDDAPGQSRVSQSQRNGNSRAQASSQQSTVNQEKTPTGPRRETPQAVRGDRSAAGGVRKPKLSEGELAEKMAKIQIKNASLAAAHARAEADAASFNQREQEAKHIAEQRRREERRDRQQMMGEREKNRQRKLKAMEGREWDAVKQEDDFRKGGKFDRKGGFAGDQETYSDGREYLYRETGGHGGRAKAGGSSGRGERVQEQTAPKQEDFPALEKAAGSSAETVEAKADSIATQPFGKSWAEQMES